MTSSVMNSNFVGNHSSDLSGGNASVRSDDEIFSKKKGATKSVKFSPEVSASAAKRKSVKSIHKSKTWSPAALAKEVAIPSISLKQVRNAGHRTSRVAVGDGDIQSKKQPDIDDRIDWDVSPRIRVMQAAWEVMEGHQGTDAIHDRDQAVMNISELSHMTTQSTDSIRSTLVSTFTSSYSSKMRGSMRNRKRMFQPILITENASMDLGRISVEEGHADHEPLPSPTKRSLRLWLVNTFASWKSKRGGQTEGDATRGSSKSDKLFSKREQPQRMSCVRQDGS